MVRKTDIRRDSRPRSHQLFGDEEKKAELEARNGLLQFDEVIKLVGEVERGASFRLRPSMLQSLHRIAIQDIYDCAGNYRTAPVQIEGTDHQPPSWQDVPRLVEEMCDYVNEHWQVSTPVYLSAYLMWRINWIHPFAGGNGRTSRAVSYLALCSRLGCRLPGILTIPDQIVGNREPYYKALDAADFAWTEGTVNVAEMESLLSALLARQLTQLHTAAVSVSPHED
jgi:Fic family protein